MPYQQLTPFSSTDVVLAYGSPVGTFLPGEGIVGGTSGAKAQNYCAAGTNKICVRDIAAGATFASGETITGQTSGATAVLSANQALNGDSTLTSPAFGPVVADQISALLTASTTHGAGTLKIQVSNDVIKLANFPNVQPTNWVDMPQYNSLPVSVTMASGAACTFQTPYPQLSWRWYRFVWTPSDTSDAYSINCNVTVNTHHD